MNALSKKYKDYQVLCIFHSHGDSMPWITTLEVPLSSLKRVKSTNTTANDAVGRLIFYSGSMTAHEIHQNIQMRSNRNYNDNDDDETLCIKRTLFAFKSIEILVGRI